MNYNLINPSFSGGTSKDISTYAENPIDAAKNIWSKLSEFIKNHTPSFYFSTKNDKGDIDHFKVKEIVKGGNVKFEINKYTDNEVHKNDEMFNKILTGGHHFKFDNFDSSDSSSSSDSFKDTKHFDDSSSSDSDYVFDKETYNSRFKNNSVLDFLTYYPNIYGINNLILPLFMSSFTPYVSIKLMPNLYAFAKLN